METITTKRPSECSETELEDFACLVCAGGEVRALGLKARIYKAEALIFLAQDNCLKGIAAVKDPEKNYKTGVFQKACATVHASVFPFVKGVRLSYLD